jgi:hypothetical protein
MNAALRCGLIRGDGDSTVIVAMIAVRMMQMAVDHVIGVVAMWHGGVTAVQRVDMTNGFFVSAMTRRAGSGIDGVDGDDVFVHMRAVGVMQMLAIKVIGVTVVSDSEMTATRAVLMWVGVSVFGMGGATTGDHRQRPDEE